MPYPVCPKCQHDARHSGLVGCLESGCDCDLGPEQIATLLEASEDQRDLTQKEGLTEGRARRDVGAAAAGDAAPAVLVSAWRADADQALDDLVEGGQEFSADDLVAIAGEPPVPNMLGGLFLGAARRGEIHAVGFRQATRPSAHARVQRTWKGAE